MTIQELNAEMSAGMCNGYKIADLQAAFSAVQDPNDWKAPIAVAVKGEAVNIIVEAIKFYTATVPTITLVVSSMMYVIESVGYRNGPAGDH